MSTKTVGQIDEIGGRIEQFAGTNIRKKVMEGSDKITASSDMKKVALWVKSAIDRLDASTDLAKREQIMLACGYNCFKTNKRPMEMAKDRRQKYQTEEAFLAAEIRKPPKGFRLEKDGNVLSQYYTPRSFGSGMRCYCSLMRKLPEGATVSSTYCQCSRGFVEKYWEGILGRRVKVELGDTAISGADECKFIIHLQ
jgi:hypothetical protein